jgi:Ca2+-binding RTX toxin-like protein
MIRRFIVPLAILALLAVIIVGVISAVAAGNSVPATRLGDSSRLITVNALKPSQCASINLEDIVTCSGFICLGSNDNDLILGSSGFQFILAGSGDDCIVGGSGGGFINGGGGHDVCIGGSGSYSFTNCEATY